jgi:site-specific DNA-methyltransferase (adenine-specific)
MAMLLHGDCLEIMKTLPDKSIDLFVCDLPYGCLGPQKKGGGIPREGTDGAFGGCAWDIPINLAEFWIQVERLMKDEHTPIIHFCNTRFGYDLINSKPDWFRYDLVWNKMRGVSFLLANKMPMKSHENIYVFAKKGATYYRKDIEGDFKGTSGGTGNVGGSVYGCADATRTKAIKREGTREGRRCVKSIIDVNGKATKGNHPTQKPAELYEWLLERYSKEGDTILDPTAGSFTSVFTAERMNRKAIGIEKDDGFYEKAKSRFSTNE